VKTTLAVALFVLGVGGLVFAVVEHLRHSSLSEDSDKLSQQADATDKDMRAAIAGGVPSTTLLDKLDGQTKRARAAATSADESAFMRNVAAGAALAFLFGGAAVMGLGRKPKEPKGPKFKPGISTSLDKPIPRAKSQPNPSVES
jgi:hypothetical protein